MYMNFEVTFLEQENLKTFAECHTYLCDTAITNEERIERTKFLDHHLRKVVEPLEQERIGQTIFHSYYKDLVFCNLKYFKNMYGLYTDNDLREDKELNAKLKDKEAHFHQVSLETKVNAAVATYTEDKKVCFELLSNIFQTFKYSTFIREMDISLSTNCFRKIPVLPFYEAVKEYLESAKPKEDKGKWTDILNALVLSSFSQLNVEETPYQTKISYSLFNSILSLEKEESVHTLFTQFYKTALNEQYNFEENKEDSSFPQIIEYITEERLKENKAFFNFHMRLIVHVFPEEFAKYVVPFSSEINKVKELAWKKDFFLKFLFSLEDKEKVFHLLLKHHTSEEEENVLAIHYLMQNRKKVFNDKLIAKIPRVPFTEETDSVIKLMLGMLKNASYSSLNEIDNSFSELSTKNVLDYMVLFYTTYLLDGYKSAVAFYTQLDNVAKLLLLETKEFIEDELIAEKSLDGKLEILEANSKDATEEKDLVTLYFQGITAFQRKLLIVGFQALESQIAVPINQFKSEFNLQMTEEKLYSNIFELHTLGLLNIQKHYVVSLPYDINQIISNYLNGNVETRTIISTGLKRHKPLLKMDLSKKLYKALHEIFPDSLVLLHTSMPSISISTALKELLDKDTFEYFLKANIEFLIVDKEDFSPLIAFEKDTISKNVTYRGKTEMKDEIFSHLGVPFIRYRFDGEIEYHRLKEELLSEIKKSLLEDENDDHTHPGSLIKLIKQL